MFLECCYQKGRISITLGVLGSSFGAHLAPVLLGRSHWTNLVSLIGCNGFFCVIFGL
jgi:hypothetical protein